jgi:hypothetical protein
MVALARKLGQILCVLAGLAAVLLMVRGNTTTSGVGALLGFGHFGFSWGCLLKLLFWFAILAGYGLSACTRTLFVDRLDHTVVACGPAVADALRTQWVFAACRCCAINPCQANFIAIAPGGFVLGCAHVHPSLLSLTGKMQDQLAQSIFVVGK